MSDWGSSVDEPKKAQEFYNLLQFIYSKKRLGLQPSVAFNEEAEKNWGLKRVGRKGIWKFERTRPGKLLAMPLIHFKFARFSL